mmetsp:Transcript_53390/g.53795  ORF Transcript_53390/g.53795 Transcript_53390/m.53795 type:complete len:122 (-) Transcript_53390:187-552(-)
MSKEEDYNESITGSTTANTQSSQHAQNNNNNHNNDIGNNAEEPPTLGSREEQQEQQETNNLHSQPRMMFSFWAKLMSSEEASPGMCRYPSISSVLSRRGEPAWQSLLTTRRLNPPTVEFLD